MATVFPAFPTMALPTAHRPLHDATLLAMLRADREGTIAMIHVAQARGFLREVRLEAALRHVASLYPTPEEP